MRPSICGDVRKASGYLPSRGNLGNGMRARHAAYPRGRNAKRTGFPLGLLFRAIERFNG